MLYLSAHDEHMNYHNVGVDMISSELINKTIQIKQYVENKELFSQLFNLNCAIIKGEPLSVLAYNQAGKRNCSDIDILLPKSYLSNVELLLQQNGFSTAPFSRRERILMLSFSHQVSPWHKELHPLGSNIIDLNFDLFWGEYTGKRIDIQDFLQDSIEMQIYGCNIKTLSPFKAFIQLILHHYKEMNSIYHLSTHNCINYNMFKDVYYLWKNNQEAVSLEKLYAISSEYEIVPYIFYVLYFTNRIFQDVDLKKYVTEFETLEGMNLLDYYGLAEKERKPWKVDFLTRLKADNLYEFIRDDLTNADIEKLKRNRRMFG